MAYSDGRHWIANLEEYAGPEMVNCIFDMKKEARRKVGSSEYSSMLSLCCHAEQSPDTTSMDERDR
jgi:hypothetical protein